MKACCHIYQDRILANLSLITCFIDTGGRTSRHWEQRSIPQGLHQRITPLSIFLRHSSHTHRTRQLKTVVSHHASHTHITRHPNIGCIAGHRDGQVRELQSGAGSGPRPIGGARRSALRLSRGGPRPRDGTRRTQPHPLPHPHPAPRRGLPANHFRANPSTALFF